MGNTESSTTCCTTPLDPLLGRRSGARSSPGSDKRMTRNALIVEPSQEGDDGTTHSELTSETFWLQHPSPRSPHEEGSNSTYDDDNDELLCNKKNDATTTRSCAETTATTTTTRDPSSSSSLEESSSVTLQQLEQECANYKKRVRQLEQLRQEDQELFRTLNDKLKHLLQVQEAYIKLQKDTQQQVQPSCDKKESSSAFLEQKCASSARSRDEKTQNNKPKHKSGSVKKKSSSKKPRHASKQQQQEHLDTNVDLPVTNMAIGCADAAASYSEHAQVIDHALAWLEANFVADKDVAWSHEEASSTPHNTVIQAAPSSQRKP